MNGDNFIKERVREQFGQNAEKYVSSAGHAHGTDLSLGIAWLKPTANDCALDIATGGGHVAKALAPLVHNVTVTDLTTRMLETARNHLTESGVQNAHYVLADAEQLPFLSNSFDVVTCRIAPHHFPNPEAFVREVSRVLRPGGRFLLIDNVAPDEASLANFVNLLEAIRDPSHMKCLTVMEWKELLNQYGLKMQNEVVRKKTHPFHSWVDRMAPTDAHRLAVESMLRWAPEEIRSYFQIVVEQDAIVQFSADEWITLVIKE